MKYISILALLPSLTIAASVTNTIEGIGPLGNIKPWICIQKGDKITASIKPGDELKDVNKASGNLYYAGASLRLDGCVPENNAYLGWLNINFGDSGKNSLTFEVPNKEEPTKNTLQINSSGKVSGEVIYPENYTAIKPNLDMNVNPQTPAKNWEFVGINLAGLEFGKIPEESVVPNLSKGPDLINTKAFIDAGMNTVRVPVSWGYLQHEINGPLDLEYYNKLVKPTLQTLTNAKINTIVDLHAYMRYSKYGEHYSGYNPENKKNPDGTLITDVEAYKSIWGQLAKLILEDPSINKEYILFDLMNEPSKMDGHEEQVFTIQAELIKMLRKMSFGGYILVEGNYWSGLHSWTTEGKKENKSNAILFSRKNFEKNGITDLSHVLINVHQYFDSDYSGTHNECLPDLYKDNSEDGFNLDAFDKWSEDNKLKVIVTEFGTGENASSCAPALRQFMKYMQENSASGTDFGFVGWTLWSTGHGWGNYNLLVKPKSYQMDVIKEKL